MIAALVCLLLLSVCANVGLYLKWCDALEDRRTAYVEKHELGHALYESQLREAELSNRLAPFRGLSR